MEFLLGKRIKRIIPLIHTNPNTKSDGRLDEKLEIRMRLDLLLG